MSSRKKVIPLCLGASGSVRANRIPQSDRWADEFHTFCPFTTNSSPSRSALVERFARSDPSARLTEQLAPHHVAPQHGREMAGSLHVGAEVPDGRPGQGDARGEKAAGDVKLGGLLLEDLPLPPLTALAPVVHWPVDGGPAAVVQLPLPRPAAVHVGLLRGGIRVGGAG